MSDVDDWVDYCYFCTHLACNRVAREVGGTVCEADRPLGWPTIKVANLTFKIENDFAKEDRYSLSWAIADDTDFMPVGEGDSKSLANKIKEIVKDNS